MTYQRMIANQDTVVTINGLSRIDGGELSDIVNIDTVTKLASQEEQEITLVLPAITGDPQRAYIRTLDEVEVRTDFQSPLPTAFEEADMPEEQREALKAAIEAHKAQWENIIGLARNVQLTKVQLKQGDQELKFFLQKKLRPNENGIYELQFIAPFSNMTPQGGFEMSLVIILPRGAVPVGQPEVVVPPGMSAPELRGDGNRCGRHIYEYYMRHDPIFTVRYHYPS